MNLYTIGFTQKSAERFFSLLRESGVQRLVDTRLNPGGQLSGFAKGSDLAWFLDRLNDCNYVHLPQLAPTAEILHDYRKEHDWNRYVQRFEELMDTREIPASLDRASFETRPSCLLCSENTPEQCHRRLVAERLAAAWPGTTVIHLAHGRRVCQARLDARPAIWRPGAGSASMSYSEIMPATCR